MRHSDVLPFYRQIGRPVLATELIGGQVYEAWTADDLPCRAASTS